jgi:hypothetical protein
MENYWPIQIATVKCDGQVITLKDGSSWLVTSKDNIISQVLALTQDRSDLRASCR